ncbi:MAG: imidazole glycerol phosphate synthase subunit HisF [Eubacteriales bacterium]
MLAKRIIPCLDVKDGRVVKGVNFVNLRDAGDPVEIAKLYNEQGADEITFLDITATHEKRKTIVDVIEKVALEVFMPLTVGGGIRTVEDFREILLAGADKIGINSAAIMDNSLIGRAADKFGSQCVVVAIDAKSSPDSPSGFSVWINGGRKDTGIDAIKWASEVERLGAGEILLTSMDTDGTKNGFNIVLTKKVTEAVRIPVIASGGGGTLEHFYDIFALADADAALAATLFHYRELTVGDVKNYLHGRGIEVRL